MIATGARLGDRNTLIYSRMYVQDVPEMMYTTARRLYLFYMQENLDVSRKYIFSSGVVK